MAENAQKLDDLDYLTQRRHVGDVASGNARALRQALKEPGKGLAADAISEATGRATGGLIDRYAPSAKRSWDIMAKLNRIRKGVIRWWHGDKKETGKQVE